MILQEYPVWMIFPISLDDFSNIYKWDWKNQPKHGVVVVPQSDQSELVTWPHQPIRTIGNLVQRVGKIVQRLEKSSRDITVAGRFCLSSEKSYNVSTCCCSRFADRETGSATRGQSVTQQNLSMTLKTLSSAHPGYVSLKYCKQHAALAEVGFVKTGLLKNTS